MSSPTDPLLSSEGRNWLLNLLLEAPPENIDKHCNVQLLNLLCADRLPGVENIDFRACLARLDRLIAFVKSSIERNLHRFRRDPDFGHCEPMWRMAMLVTNLKLDFGVAYDPRVKADLERDGRSPFTDSRNAFIHGLLGEDPKRRWGSCSSIPVLVTAVARRLGYPVRLAVNRKHIWARWEDDRGLKFNIEASNPMGMTAPDDKHYRTMYGPPTEQETRSGLYCRSLSPAEEFSLFMKARVWSLYDAARYGETLLWSARALQFCPDAPHFPLWAYNAAMLAIQHRYRHKYPDRFIPPPEQNKEFFFILGEFLRIEERSLFLTIAAHREEYAGELDKARTWFIESARQNFHGNNEQRDLQRFLKKHGRAKDRGTPFPPRDIGQPRRIKLRNCPPEREYATLQTLADQFEREGELLKARDTLHDLYLFDPTNAEVFCRARSLEQQPQFQSQFNSVAADHRRMLEKSGRLKRSHPLTAIQ